MPYQSLDVFQQPNVVQALKEELNNQILDLTLPWSKTVGPGTKTLNVIKDLKEPLSGTDLIGAKHDLRYYLSTGTVDTAKADVQAIYENATTAPTSFTDLVTKQFMTVGLGLKTAFWDFHPVNIWNNMSSTNKEVLPKSTVEKMMEQRGMYVSL